MNKDLIFKLLRYFSVGFIIVIALEVIDIVLFSSIINLTLGLHNLSIINIIFVSGFTPLEVVIEWLILITTICAFLILGIILLNLSFRRRLEEGLFARFILLIGLFFLISGLIQLFIIYQLGDAVIHYDSTSIMFQTAIYSGTITPFIGVIMWLYFSAMCMVILIAGTVFGGVGLKLLLDFGNRNKAN
ncbi:MAG: hypothetical protein ACFFBH_15760 [Promethearchaeota archaeon]